MARMAAAAAATTRWVLPTGNRLVSLTNDSLEARINGKVSFEGRGLNKYYFSLMRAVVLAACCSCLPVWHYTYG